MKVILLEKVKGLGEPGELVEVAPGHARNLLFPRGMAEEATAENLARREARLQRRAREQDRARQDAELAKERLSGAEVVVRAKAGQSGRLFGSVTPADVARAVFDQLAIRVDRRRLDLTEPLKSLGSHAVTVHLHPDFAADITVRIEAAK